MYRTGRSSAISLPSVSLKLMSADRGLDNIAELADSSDEVIPALNDEAKELAFSDPGKAMAMAQRAFALSEARGYPEGKGKALLNMGLCHFVRSELASAQAMWQQARDLFYEADIPLGAAQALNNLGNYYSRIGDSLAALDCYSDAAALYRTMTNPPGYAAVSTNIGLIFKSLGDFPRALQHYKEALEVLTNAPAHLASKLHTLNNIGNVYLDLGDYSQALEVFTDSLALAQQTANKRAEAMVLNNIGNVQERMRNMDGALEYYRRSLELKQEIGDRLGEGNTLGNIGVIYQHLDQFELAGEYLNNGLAIFHETGDRAAASNALLNLGVVYRRSGNFALSVETLLQVVNTELDLGNREAVAVATAELSHTYIEMKQFGEAESALKRVLATAIDIQAKPLMVHIYELLARLYKEQGNFEQALECHEHYHQVQQEVFNDESDRRLQMFIVQLQMERTEKERETYRARAELLEQEVEFKRRELASHALNLVERNKLLGNVRRSLERLSEGLKPDNRARVQDILKTMRGNETAASEWEVFSDKFQELHGEFMQTLSGLYPDLSPTELKICALTKIHLSTKEISAILHTSIRTIEAHRYRLRKKLIITADVSLTSFLNSL